MIRYGSEWPFGGLVCQKALALGWVIQRSIGEEGSKHDRENRVVMDGVGEHAVVGHLK